MKNQSERQFGAFCLAYSVSVGNSWNVDLKQVQFRNSVIHKGHIATKLETHNYASYITKNLDTLITELILRFEKESLDLFFHVKEQSKSKIEELLKKHPGVKYVAVSKPSLLNWYYADRKSLTFEDVLRNADLFEARFGYI